MTERSGVIEVPGASRPDINHGEAVPWSGGRGLFVGRDPMRSSGRVPDKESRPERPSAKRGRQQLARVPPKARAGWKLRIPLTFLRGGPRAVEREILLELR